jgi:hypothetical protein
MRFVIEVPDELLRGVTGTGAAEAAPIPAQRAPMSGGAAADGAGPGIGTLTETLSAGPAEGGGVPALLEDGVMALDGGAAPG